MDIQNTNTPSVERFEYYVSFLSVSNRISVRYILLSLDCSSNNPKSLPNMHTHTRTHTIRFHAPRESNKHTNNNNNNTLSFSSSVLMYFFYVYVCVYMLFLC